MAKLRSLTAGLGSKFSTQPAAIKPMKPFARLYHRIPNRPPAHLKEQTIPGFFGKVLLKYGLTTAFIYYSFEWVDYGGYSATGAEWDKLHAEIENERMAYSKALHELDQLRMAKQVSEKLNG